MKLMKKISILLILILLVSMMGGCISKKTTADDDSNPGNTDSVVTDDNGSPEPDTDDNSPDETFEAGQELSGFIQAYLDTKEPLYDKLSTATETDFTMMMAWVGILTADLTIAFVPLFDLVDANGGVFMMTEIDNAFKKINGNTIDFGYDYLYKADNNSGFPAGSHSTFVGKYNIAKNSMSIETVDDKGTDGITRTVMEITRNAADSYTTQYITSNAKEITAYFTFFSGESFLSYAATKDQGIDFTFNSIYEKSNPTIDDMNAGFTLTSTIKYAGGTATYETMTE